LYSTPRRASAGGDELEDDPVEGLRLIGRRRVARVGHDDEARALEAYVLGAQEYSIALRASGSDLIAPPPFGDVALVPASLFP